MQCKSLPGHHSTQDLNVDAHCSKWPLYNVSKTLDGGHYYNIFLPPPAPDRHLGYDKEVIKQTMLKHEVLFRDQVHELHRLYRRQRELMVEIRSKELYKHHIQLETSQSNPFLTQIPSALVPSLPWVGPACNRLSVSSAENIQPPLSFIEEKSMQTGHDLDPSADVPSLPWVNPACDRPSVSSAENIQLPLSFTEGRKSMQAGHDFDQTEGNYKYSELLESKCQKFQKRKLDLQLPANEYVDSEEGEWFEEERDSDVPSYSLRKISKVVPETDSFLRRTTGLIDLNEPFQFEDAESLNSVDFLSPVTSHREIPNHDLSEKTNTGFQVLSKETSQNTQTISDLESCSNILDAEKKERGGEWLPCNDEAGQSGSNLNSFAKGFCSEKLSTSSKPLQVEAKKAHELPTSLPLDKSNEKTCSERINFGLDIPKRNRILSRSNHPKLVGASCMPTSCQLVPQSNMASFESSSVTTRRKSKHDWNRNPIAVQALPCFNTPATLRKGSKSSIGSSGLIGGKIQFSKSLRHSPSSMSMSSLQNSFCHGSQLESKTSEACATSTRFDYMKCNNKTDSASGHGPTKYSKGSETMDVKFVKDMNLNFMPPDCSPVVAVSKLDTRTMDGEKLEDTSGESPWRKAKLFYDGIPRKGRGSNSMKSGFFQAFSSCIRDVEPKRVDKSECPSNDQFSSLTSPSNSDQCPSEDEDIENSENVGVRDIYLVPDPIPESRKQTADDMVVRTGLGKKHLRFGNHIDLNSCINDDDASPTLFVQRSVLKSTAEIDLEAPVSPEKEECSPPRGESDENPLETPFQLSGQENGDQQEELLRFAAEALVSISSSGVQICLESATCESSEASSGDPLRWFAGVVFSVAVDSENEIGVDMSGKDGGKEILNDAIDYFEAMTLKLTETKVEEYSCKSNCEKQEETDATLLPRQQRRGRMRRGRRWKDFQSEVLPCLTSLSRHEVTEDLQTIEGLMEAAGTPWETGLSRKNASRNGWVRGRRRSCISTSNVVETTVCSQLNQQTKRSELGFDERSLTGWGKITRRRRGQRCPASNLTLILSQV
ncbi:hypothetical protein L1049_028331 [Liquidambar formosana]|uniref:Uncharacterized protein n=1 Tax=Liquidambar formosana TaxID=63359 RepID=A0AAP0WT74_LIQFO